MGIKETPTNLKTYYKLMIADSEQRRDEARELRNDLLIQCRTRFEDIKDDIQSYDILYGVNLLDYDEFVQNKYINGSFYKVAKGLLLNKEQDYKLVSDLYDLFALAELQKRIYDVEKEIELCNKLTELSLKQYTEILRTYYTEVHKQIVLEGNGYSLGQIGWICANRCVIKRARPIIDFAATKKREAELKAQGKRIYNKEEAEWCERNGIEYKAEDKRVFKKNEYCYEIPLIGCKLPNGSKLKLEISDYRHTKLRGKSNQTLIEDCNSDTRKICELRIDLKTKLTLCDTADKILYTKFIRNENQESLTATAVNRKNRQ